MNKAIGKVIKSHVLLTVLSVVAVVLMAGGVSYALFQDEKVNTKNQKIAIGNLSADLTSVSGKIVLNDLYPESANDVTEENRQYTFRIMNDGDYDIEYKIYLTDETESLLTTSTEYSSYKKLIEEHYKYINYKLDGEKLSSLGISREEDKFVVLKGNLKVGEYEDHYLQFFLDNGDTTREGAPNDINGSVISLDIYMEAGAKTNEGELTLEVLGLNKKEGTPDFSRIAETDETRDGLYSMEDDYGTSYYFRGAVENNYVKFGQNANGEDMWWRIIRINGDGSLRIQYDGTQGWANGEANDNRVAITNQPWNSQYNDAKYVGWMFGGAQGEASTSYEQATRNETNSDIKTSVDIGIKRI